MPYVERYFAQRHFDSSFEPCLKKSRLDYSALCKKKKTEEFIPLEAPSESSSGFSETRHYGSVKSQREKPRVSKDFLNGLDNEAKGGSSRNYNSEAHFSRKESKLDYLELCTKRNSEEFIPLGTRSENCSPSGFSENSYYGSDKSEYEKERDGENFQNDFDNEEESGPSKNYSSEAHSTRIKSKPDNSALSKKRNNEEYISLETQSENRSPSGFSETRYYGSDKGKHEKSRFGEDFKIGFYIDKKPGLSQNFCSEPPLSWTVDSNKNQQILGLPKTDKWQNNNSEAAFSETSTAFIGPLYQPPPQADTVSKTTNNENSKSPSFRITTVVSGKAAGRTKSEGGMDYEMRQFYKELNQLEAATDDHNVIQTTANSQQHCSSHQSSAPTIQEVRDHHNQKPSSQLCNPISCKPLALNPPSYHPTEAPISPVEHPTLPPINNQDYCNRPVPIYRTSSSFVSWSLPPPSFQGPPPSAFDRTDSSFVSQSLPPPCFQSPLPPAFDRTNSNFVSQPLHPPCFQGPPPAFDRTNSSHLSQSLPPPSFQGPPPPAFDRTDSSFVSQSLPPPCFQSPSPPAFNRTNSSFVSQSLRPPCYQGSPPPAFADNNGPTPPRHNYPLIFPREDDIRNSPYPENEKYRSLNEDYPRPTTQAPWHSSHVLPENRLSPQGRSFTEPVPRPPFESSQQGYQREDFYEQKGRSFNEILPQGGNEFHEQYLPKFRDEAKCTDSKKKLVLLRGVPGSGKSTLASILLDQSPNGIVFSTDDYFCQENGYSYDVKLLGDAHNWNQKRAQRAMDDGRSPIIIDNTNIQSWEMKPYVQMALEGGYAVEFLEPNTWWKLDPHELEKRNTHRVPREKISQMLERFEHNMNVGVVMNSVEPRRVRHRRPPSENRQRWGTSVDYTSHSSSFQIR